MPEAQQTANALGLDLNAMMIAVTVAVQAFFVLFFVVSPIAGMLMGRVIKKRASLVITTMLALLAFNLTFVGLPYLLNGQRFMADLNNNSLFVIALAGGLITALFTLYAATMFLAEPEATLDIKHLPDLPTATPGLQQMQQKRLENQKKRGRR